MTFRGILLLQAAPPFLFLHSENFIVAAKQIPPIRGAVILAKLIVRLLRMVIILHVRFNLNRIHQVDHTESSKLYASQCGRHLP